MTYSDADRAGISAVTQIIKTSCGVLIYFRPSHCCRDPIPCHRHGFLPLGLLAKASWASFA